MNFYAATMAIIMGGLSLFWLNRAARALEMPRISPWLTYALFVWFVFQLLTGCVTNTYVYNDPVLDSIICSGDPDDVEKDCERAATLRCSQKGFSGVITRIEESTYPCGESACFYLFFKCEI